MNRKKKKKLNVLSTGWNVVFLVILTLVALTMLLPMVLVIIISFSSTESIRQVGYSFLPKEWSLQGWEYLLKMGDQLLYSYEVTIAYSVLGTVLSLFVMMMCAYVISRSDFWLRKQLTWFIFFTMLFGGGLVPSYILNVNYYHLKDSFWILILPGLVGAYNIIILRTFIKTTIPEGLFDAARIDGAGHFTIFFKIVIPLSKAGIATVGLFTFVGKWNDWFTGMLYVNNSRLVPLQTLLVRLQNNVDIIKNNATITNSPDGVRLLKNMPSTNLRMACTVAAVLPLLFAYPFFQRYFVNGLTVGSIKE